MWLISMPAPEAQATVPLCSVSPSKTFSDIDKPLPEVADPPGREPDSDSREQGEQGEQRPQHQRRAGCPSGQPFLSHSSQPALCVLIPLVVSYVLFFRLSPTPLQPSAPVIILPGSFLCWPSAGLSQALFTRFLENSLCICRVSFETGSLISFSFPFPCSFSFLEVILQRLLMEQLLWCAPNWARIFSQLTAAQRWSDWAPP